MFEFAKQSWASRARFETWSVETHRCSIEIHKGRSRARNAHIRHATGLHLGRLTESTVFSAINNVDRVFGVIGLSAHQPEIVLEKAPPSGRTASRFSKTLLAGFKLERGAEAHEKC